MELKKIAAKIAYIPARLAQKKDRWEIVYYQTDPADGIRKRYRETGDLNRIKDLKQRKKHALQLVNRINDMLPEGYPFKTAQEIEQRAAQPTIHAAVSLAIEIKLKTDRYETQKDYRSIGGVLLAWLETEKIGGRPISDFTRRQALAFLDYVAERKTSAGDPLSNRTWNNYKTKTSTLFGELVRRETIQDNPFKGITKKPVAPKKRRKCSPDERATIAAWLFHNDFYLFLFVTLEYYCLLRGTELRRLRASDFDLGRGIITLCAENSKTRRDRFPTLPPYVLEILTDARFYEIPGNYFVFGKGGRPNARAAWGRGHAWKYLRRALFTLKKAGKLESIEGISPYSFKDTGITEWLKMLPLPSVMQQAGHTNPGTTMLYYQPDLVNTDFKGIKTRIDSTDK